MSLLLYPYAKVIFYNHEAELGIAPGHYKYDEVVDQLEGALRGRLEDMHLDDLLDYRGMAEQLFEDLRESEVIKEENQKYAGTYFFRDEGDASVKRKEFLRSSEINQSAGRIGARYYPDVFSGFRNQFLAEQELESLGGGAQLLDRERVSDLNWESVRQNMTPAKIEDLKLRIDGLVDAIRQSELTDRQKQNAEAHARAIEKLLEAPDPPWEVIVDLLNNRYFSALLNAAAILQLIIGATL